MHLYESGEDYLEAVLVLQKKIGEVRSVDVEIMKTRSKATLTLRTMLA